jgi:hypothetical protein
MWELEVEVLQFQVILRQRETLYKTLLRQKRSAESMAQMAELELLSNKHKSQYCQKKIIII